MIFFFKELRMIEYPFVIAFFKIDFGSVMCFCYNFLTKKFSNEKSV